jgi:hypothetical protein
MRLALWEVQPKENAGPNIPVLTGEVIVNNIVYPVVIWKNESDNPKAPKYKGRESKPKESPKV